MVIPRLLAERTLHARVPVNSFDTPSDQHGAEPMSKSNVNPNHYKVAGRERQGENIAQIRYKQKLAENLARRRSEPGVGFQNPAPVQEPASTGAVKKRSARKAAGAAPTLTSGQAPKRASVNLQAADKRGKRSTAQKRASSRPDLDPIPATRPVSAAFGKEPAPRRRRPRKG
jgi:hypothetical protein